jgi:acyl carrier protein
MKTAQDNLDRVPERVLRILGEHFRVQHLNGTETLVGLDSDDLTILEITIDLEDEFQITIDDDEFDTFERVQQIIDYVTQLVRDFNGNEID